MQDQKPWYNTERVSQPGSVILNTWLEQREAAKAAAVPAVRNSTQFISSSSPAIIELLGGAPASSGYPVTETTAMRVSAVHACIQLLGGIIASLPINVYQRNSDGDGEQIDSPLWWTLNERPCPAWTAASMFEFWMRCNALRGDAFGEMKRNAGGVITGIVPWHPDRTTVETEAGELRYYYQPRNGKAYGRHADDVLHIPGFGYDGDIGRSHSIIRSGGFQSIGIALAADDFSGKFFANGATPKHLIKSEGKLNEDQIAQLRNLYSQRYTGSDNIGKPMVLTQGLDVKELSMSAVDAELLESRKYQVIDIARAFGVPPFMIGANDTTTSWGAGVEQMTLGFVKFTLKTYLNRYEQEINSKFFRTSRYYVEFALDDLLRGDSKSEGEFLRQARGGSMGPGWMTLNEIRRLKKQKPIDGGDTIYEPKGKQDAQAPAAATA